MNFGSNVGIARPAMDRQSPVMNVVKDAQQLLNACKDETVTRVYRGHLAASPRSKGLRYGAPQVPSRPSECGAVVAHLALMILRQLSPTHLKRVMARVSSSFLNSIVR